jgi:polyferredoxin
MKVLRTAVQLFFLAGVVTLLARGLAGLTPNTCETYCPFGGLVALFPLAKYKQYTCALTELNVALLVSLVVLTVATKKSFCSWICPLGTVQEWVGRVGRKVFGRYPRVPTAPDRTLMLLRYAVLVAVPILTYTVWQYDLGFRAYDPYYILFTWGGHEVAAFSVFIVIGVLAAAFFLPFAWCRYLCPLGAMMDPLSRPGGFRLRRNTETCTVCGKCDAACPHAIPVSQVKEVTARNCTNCMDCVEQCPVDRTLELSWFGK